MSQYSADIIIVGGGIIGCALFYEFTKATRKKIVLIEQGGIASKTTGDSGALVRLDDSSENSLRLTSYSLDYYRNFQQHVGCESSFVESGCLYINTQHRLQFQPLAGYINPIITCQQWVRSAEKLQAKIIENTAALQILQKNNKILGIKTKNGEVFAKNVIIAAGAYSAKLLNTLPNMTFIKTLHNQSFQYSLYQYQHHRLPAIIDVNHDIYIIPQQNYFIAGFLNQDQMVIDEQPMPKNPELTQRLNQSLEAILMNFSPEASLLETKVSVDAFTADHEGYTGSILPYEGLYLTTGYSGGGIKIAPAIAKKVIEYFI